MATDIQNMVRMLRHCERVVQYSEGITFEDFSKDTEKQDALLFNVGQVGEIVSKISPEFKAEHPEFAWSPMKQLRNHVVHNYDGLSYDIIWDVIQYDIPGLIPLIHALLDNQMVVPGVQ